MIGLELAVEQREPAEAQPRDQPRQRHFRRVARTRYHALAEKGAPQRQPVQPADQLFAVPDFDRMREAALVQRGEDAFDRPVDPGVGPILRRLRA